MNKQLTDAERARQLLDNYGGEADDFFKLWPTDKTFFFASDNKSFVAYAVKLKVAVCLGDPVGNRASIKKLLLEFSNFCNQNHLLMCFIQATNKYQEEYQTAKLSSLLIGADAVIDLELFSLETVHDKYFRNLVNRSNKLGFSLSNYSPPHAKELIAELHAVSTSWGTLPHRKEWSFLTGRFDRDYLDQVDLHVVRDKNGQAQAFANGLPDYKPGVITVDLMRHRADAPPNSIDFLFIKLLSVKKTEGYKHFNLGISPLDANNFMKSPAEKLLNKAYKLSNSFIGFTGLHHFKAKYKPNWEPRYIFYQKGPGRLLRMGLAVLLLLQG